ncbi:MAG: InlB B-repeat-containing protein [Ruminococcus sp.]|nr:InlB B-repeat-containing protein [Ruminococcus sp.]
MDYRIEDSSSGEPNVVISGVPFEKPISEVIEEHPELMTPPERSYYDFAGWYLDPGCTKKAEFSKEIMPAANRVYYAKWELKKYIVEIDPDGGEMQAGNIFSAYTTVTGSGAEITYNRVQYGNSVLAPQGIKRSYAPAHNGEYIYVNVRLAPTIEAAAANWDKMLSEDYRSAFYCKLTELDTVYDTYFAPLKNGDTQLLTYVDFLAYCVDSTHRYRKIADDEVGQYVLDGWRKVNADGTTSAVVYHFGDPVTENTRVRAVWKRTGAYYLQYDPYDSRYNVGRDVMVDDEMMHNSVLYDPSAPGDISSPGAAYYHDHAQAVVLQHPTYIPAHYIFRGWELLTDDGEKTGEYYAPGDAFTVDSAYADRQGYIHFEAAYEPETESVRIVETAALTLDANTSHSGYAVSNGLSIYPDSVYADLEHNQVIFADQPNNFKVRLSEYYNNFLNSEGYQLIGWSKTPDDLVPDFAPDAVIGVDTTDNENDILYAVWEPMYYLTLENHSTDYNITFDLQFTGNSGAVYAVESGSATGSYIREPFGTGYTSDSIGGQPKFYYSKFDPADLTHDNRYEFYRGIDNLRLENGDLNPNAKYIFKVYAYMKLSDDDDSIYQSEGVTVQLYDLAIRTSIAG